MGSSALLVFVVGGSVTVGACRLAGWPVGRPVDGIQQSVAK